MPKLNDLIRKEAVIMDLKASTKNEALKELSEYLLKQKYISDAKAIEKAFLKRESEFSTGLGDAVAIPHAQDESVLKNTVLIARSKKGIPWDAVDNQPVNLIFCIALNTKDATQQVEVLQELAAVMTDQNKLANIRSAAKPIDVVTFALAEAHKIETVITEGSKKIVAITACPTGIAHTYIAADALVKAAGELGYAIKVETQGRAIENSLSQKEVDDADAIILAIDKKIDHTERFGGKKVLTTGTKEAIKDSKKLIERALAGEGKVQPKAAQGSQNAAVASGSSELSWKEFRSVYKNLMGGVSRMLPFVVAGGIILGIGFLLDSGITGGNFGVTRTVSRWFSGLGKTAFAVFVPVLGGYVAFSIVGPEGLLPGFVAGIIASGGGILYSGLASGSVVATGWNNLWGGLTPTVDNDVLTAGSGFIGAMFGGYVAAAMVTVLRLYVFKKVNRTFHGIVAIIAMPVLSVLMSGVIMFVAQIPLAYFAYGLKLGLKGLQTLNLLALLGAIIGGMMAIDMGGPINKVAYTFGTGLIGLSTAGVPEYEVMAPVMIGGMTPPLVIAFSTITTRKQWSETDRNAGYANILMGLFFITEGAIPFAAKDPKRVIPCLMISSIIASAIVGGLQIGISAPHGGIFVFALLRCYLFSGTGLQIGLGVVFTLGAMLVGVIAGGLALNFIRARGRKNAKTAASPVLATA